MKADVKVRTGSDRDREPRLCRAQRVPVGVNFTALKTKFTPTGTAIACSARVPTSQRRDDQYRRVTVYLTPAQHQWTKQPARAAAEGLSASDVVRLALARLE